MRTWVMIWITNNTREFERVPGRRLENWAVETDTDTEADLRYLRGRGTSLGGMRPKCTVIDDEGWLAIGKFPSVADDRSVTRGEVLALHLAAAAGIDAAGHFRLTRLAALEILAEVHRAVRGWWSGCWLAERRPSRLWVSRLSTWKLV